MQQTKDLTLPNATAFDELPQTILPFKRSSTCLVALLAIRALVLSLIALNFMDGFNERIPSGIQFDSLRAMLLVFYLPLAVILLSLTLLQPSARKLLIGTIACDLLALLWFDNVIQLFVS